MAYLIFLWNDGGYAITYGYLTAAAILRFIGCKFRRIVTICFARLRNIVIAIFVLLPAIYLLLIWVVSNEILSFYSTRPKNAPAKMKNNRSGPGIKLFQLCLQTKDKTKRFFCVVVFVSDKAYTPFQKGVWRCPSPLVSTIFFLRLAMSEVQLNILFPQWR